MSEFICPVCTLPLQCTDKTYSCDNGHVFDISKYGYVNLLMSQQSSLKRHGDDKAMVQARRDFLSKGFYQPLRDALCAVVNSNVLPGSVIADIGCGEGYYLNAISEQNCFDIYGIDISKDALRYASRLIKNGEFSVASAFSLPFADSSADCILNVFAPSAYEEFSRVLKPTGVLIKAVPLKEHLWGLKQALYDEPYKNKPEIKNDNLFSLVSVRELKYTINLNNSEDIKNLFMMTPYFYKTGKSETEKLLKMNSLSTTVHFAVEVYKIKR